LFLIPTLVDEIENCVYKDGPIELEGHNGHVSTLSFDSQSDRLLTGFLFIIFQLFSFILFYFSSSKILNLARMMVL